MVMNETKNKVRKFVSKSCETLIETTEISTETNDKTENSEITNCTCDSTKSLLTRDELALKQNCILKRTTQISFLGIVCEELIRMWGKWMAKNQDKPQKIWRIFYRTNCFVLFPTNASIALDLSVICAIYTICGPYTDTNVTNFNGAIDEILLHLIDKYNLNINYQTMLISQKQNVLTLINIAKCFPNVCCELYAMGICGKMVKLNIFGEKIKTKKRAIFCPLFPMVASSIFFRKNKPNIIPQLLLIASKTNKYLFTDFKQELNLNSLWKNLKNDINSKIIDEGKRAKLCVRWGLMNHKKIPNGFWDNTRSYAQMELHSIFGKTQFWPTVSKEMDEFHLTD